MSNDLECPLCGWTPEEQDALSEKARVVETLNKHLGEGWAEQLADRLEKHGEKHER